MDRATDFGSVGWGFESLQAHHFIASVAELVDALDLGSSIGRCGSSTLPARTICVLHFFLKTINFTDMENYLSVLNNLSKDRIHGSSYIVNLMLDAAIAGFGDEIIERLIEDIIMNQSSMASVINIGFKIIDVLRKGNRNNLNFLQREFEDARESAILEAANKLSGIKRLCTISSSKSVEHVIYKIMPEMVYLSVGHPKNEGELFAEELLQNNINVVLFEDVFYSSIIKETQAVLSGADAMFDKYFINKIGTKCLSISANDENIPFFVVADKFKYLSRQYEQYFKLLSMPEAEISKLNCRRVNYYFEHIPNGLIKKFFTGE